MFENIMPTILHLEVHFLFIESSFATANSLFKMHRSAQKLPGPDYSSPIS